MKVRLFNGFVPGGFNAQHQTRGQMGDWYGKLKRANPDISTFFEDKVEDCWAWPMVKNIGDVQSADYPHSPRDRYLTPEDALRSQVILCQRFDWLWRMAKIYPDTDVFAWVEYTIFKQRGITEDVIKQFISDIERHPVDAISLPGVLEKQPIVDHINHWRFSGSTWVCPRKYAQPVSDAMKELITMRTRLTRRLCWDNSSWSYLELLNVLPLRWYYGNHDETQLTGYLTGADQWPSL